jgi:hypothetical protein
MSTTRKTLFLLGACALIVGAMTAGAVRAELVNVDLNSNNAYDPLPSPDYVGLAAGPGPGTTWNHILPYAAGNSGPLVNSLGDPTSVLFFQNFGAAVPTQQNGDGPTGNPLTDRNPLASDIWVGVPGSEDTAPFGFVGLNPASTYDLYVYNTGNGASVYLPTVYTLNGDNAGKLTATGQNVGVSPENWALGKNYVKFTGITGVTAASLTMNNGGLSAFGTAVSGLQLVQEVPEPSTLVLLAVSLAGLLAYAWRKRR